MPSLCQNFVVIRSDHVHPNFYPSACFTHGRMRRRHVKKEFKEEVENENSGCMPYSKKDSNKMTNYYTSVEMDIWYSQCANWILNGYPSLQKAGKEIICTNQKRTMPSVDKNIKYCDEKNNPVSCYDQVKCNISIIPAKLIHKQGVMPPELITAMWWLTAN